jgi:hypothetical protein
MAHCKKCGAGIPENPVCISAELSGDEYTECWYFCGKCGVYSVESFTEPFADEETTRVEGPIPKDEGDKKVALARQCETPWEKKCDCDAHKEYFKGMS